MADQIYALPPGSRILVTGANGYIASHVVNLLLERGYRVRGQVRQPRPWLDKLFQQKYGDLFESVILPRLDDRDAIAPLLEDISGVVLIATDNSMRDDPSIVEATVQTNLTWLELAAERSSIKRVVLTSSASSITLAESNVHGRFNKDSWNSFAPAAVKSRSPELAPFMGGLIYCAAKTESEREALKWVEEHQPAFAFNSVVPYFNIGPRMHPESGSHMTSMAMAVGLTKGAGEFMPLFPPLWYVSVEDTAQLHIAALLHPELKSERIFAMAGPFNWTDVIGVLRKLQPDNDKIPNPPLNEGTSLHEFIGVEKAEQILRDFCGRPGWTSLEDCFAAGLPTYE